MQTKKQEAEKTAAVEAQKLAQTIVEQKAAKQKIQKDMTSQKDKMQQRLAERKRSVAMRANSQMVNQTLPLNFDHTQKQSLQEEGDNSLSSVQVPMMRTSAMSGMGESPIKKSTTLRLNNKRDDDTFSQGNRSTTT